MSCDANTIFHFYNVLSLSLSVLCVVHGKGIKGYGASAEGKFLPHFGSQPASQPARIGGRNTSASKENQQTELLRRHKETISDSRKR